MDAERLGKIIECAIEEDAGQGDVTSMWVLPPNAIARGQIVAREAGVLAGIGVAQMVFNRVNALIAFSTLKEEGQVVIAEEGLATVVGPAISVFTAERVALNFLEHMSGIATTTRRYVEAVKGTNAVILGTRETTPCLREIEQWAVRLGGGGNRRAKLDDMVLIRDSHAATAGGIAAAMTRVRQVDTDLQIVIEVETWEELDEALPLEPARIVLTGMPALDIGDAVKWVAGRVPLEASGKIALDEVREIAETGVDYISVGGLIHSAPALHITLDIDMP